MAASETTITTLHPIIEHPPKKTSSPLNSSSFHRRNSSATFLTSAPTFGELRQTIGELTTVTTSSGSITLTKPTSLDGYTGLDRKWFEENGLKVSAGGNTETISNGFVPSSAPKPHHAGSHITLPPRSKPGFTDEARTDQRRISVTSCDSVDSNNNQQTRDLLLQDDAWLRKAIWNLLWREEENHWPKGGQREETHDGVASITSNESGSDWDPEAECEGIRTPMPVPSNRLRRRKLGIAAALGATGHKSFDGHAPENGGPGEPTREYIKRRRNPFSKEAREDWERAFIWAVRGGIRCFILGFGARSSVNVLLTLFNILKKGKLRGALRTLWGAAFATNSIRMGGMLSIFTLLYRFSKASFRLLRSNPEEEKHWDAAVAGAIASLAILAESKDNRLGLAQQIFIRGCRGLVNVAQFKGWKFPKHGDIILFGLANAQIMYASLVQPDTLEPGYRRWVIDACQMPNFFGYLSAEKIRNGTIDPKKLETVLSFPGASPSSKAGIEALIEKAKKGDFGTSVIPCDLISHPNTESCHVGLLGKFIGNFKFIAPVYATLHLVPSLLFKPKAFTSHPISFLRHALFGILRSCTFLATYVWVIIGSYCLRSNLINKWGSHLPQLVRKTVLGGGWFWAGGFMTCLGLFFEHKKRRAELAMYCISKAMDSIRNIVRKKPYVPSNIPGGEVLLTASALSMVMSCYQHHPERLSKLVRQLLYQLVGRA